VLNAEEASRYRGLAARANYMAQDRPDVQYAVKEAARRMASPCEEDWILLKRLGRYLAGSPRVIYRFPWQSRPTGIDTFTDSDWAGCKGTRRSTSGGVVMHGQHCIKSWSSTQATVALSSAEAELYALVKGASQTLGIIAMGADFGMTLDGRVHTDASAALGIVNRQGLGKLRHISVQYLWIQDKVRTGGLAVSKVPGHDNPADLFTKHLCADAMQRHVGALGLDFAGGRARSAPALSRVTEGTDLSYDDQWVDDNDDNTTTLVRLHSRARRSLFTPLRVKGSPPAKALTPSRITEGTFCDTGEGFRRVDTWTARSTAHLSMERAWVGKTTFLKRRQE